MPSLRDSLIAIDPARYKPVSQGPARAPVVNRPAPPLPPHLSRSVVMISSMPTIATNVDGITRQFYGIRGGLPTRRLIQA